MTPDREVWSGSAEMVVAHGVDGEVGILSGHAPLLVQLGAGRLRVQGPDGAWFAVEVGGGFMHVGSDEGATRVDVLASSAEMEASPAP